MALTDTQIRNVKPTEKPYKLADGGGLYLTNGSKYWRLKCRYLGTEKLLKSVQFRAFKDQGNL